MPKKQQTLFERVGGKQVIAELIDEFYDRVLVDPELKPFFKDTSVDKLRRMQREFFSIAVYRTCRHLVPIANGILQSPYNNCGRGIAPYVYRGCGIDPGFGRWPESDRCRPGEGLRPSVRYP